MKKFFLFFCLLIAFFSNALLSQKFIKYQSWTSQKYQFPGGDNARLICRYDSIKFVAKGNWNNGIDSNGIPIQSLAYLTTDAESRINIFSVESQGYRILDPTTSYEYSHKVNQQENLNLEECFKDTLFYQNTDSAKIKIIERWDRPSGATIDPYTKHPTISRYIDASSPRKFPNPANLKFAVSGNFIGSTRSEIMLFYYSQTNNFKIYLGQNTKTTDSLNYGFTVDSIYKLNGNNFVTYLMRFVVSGDFDGDGNDEVLVIKKRAGIQDTTDLYMMKYYSSAWHFDLKATFLKSSFDLDNILFAIAGDFDGNDTCDLAFFEKIDSTNKIRILQNNNYSTLTTKYTGFNSQFNFSHIQQAVSGNFNGDAGGTGNPLDEIALFYDNGNGTESTGLEAVQEVLITDHNATNWNYTSVIKEHRDNINFEKSKTKFAFAGNFDRDIKKRDDLGVIYLGIDNDGARQSNYQKALMWLSLPSFTENDFIMDTTNGTSSGKFVPVGIEAIRLQTGSIDSVTYFNGQKPKEGYVRTNTQEYKNKISKLFNTIIVDRIDYTDAYDEYSVRGISGNKFNRRTTTSRFDFWSNKIDSTTPTGYIYSLRSYLDSADKYHMKVIPRMTTAHMSIYDDSLATNDAYIARYTTFANTTQMPIPKFVSDNVNDNIIENHRAFLGWYLYDEPDLFKAQGRLDIWDVIDYKEHFIRNNYPLTVIPRLNQADRLPEAKVIHKNYYNYVNSISNKPLFGNFLAINNDFDYYFQSYDIGIFDVYPYLPDRTYYGLSKYVGVSKSLFESAIKNNKNSAMTWLQGSGYESVDNQNIHYYGTPNHFAQRFSLFSQAIEGVRGFFYFIHPPMLLNDTLHGAITLTVSEFNNYIPIFSKENLNYRVSTTHDRFVTADYSNDGCNFSNMINYSLHYDTTAKIYYLFVSNMDYYQTVDSIKYSVFVESGTSNDVYLLSSDYFKTGSYNKITSNKDANGNYIQFYDAMELSGIKIYTIGGIPAIRTLADSIGMKGYLSYSNQNKLVAYPKSQNSVRSFGSVDTIRYHAVYHREITPNSGRMGVYYRRSNPMTIDFPQDLIDWEPKDTLLSDQIRYNGEVIDNCANCKYPSIVVRYDSVSANPGIKVYVVYECKGTAYLNYIVETSFFDNSIPPSYGNLLDTLIGADLDKWGHPVVNASYNGNYYSWSDYEKGIVAAWKNARDTFFLPFNKINFQWYSSNPAYAQATHPALNVYSRIWLGEDDCALVWQEKQYPDGSIKYNDICYSRLRMVNNVGLINYVTDSVSSCNSNSNLGIVNSTNTILKITNSNSPWNYYENQLPVIYRANGNDNFSGYYNLRAYHHERLYWQCKDPYERNIIGYSYIDLLDTLDNSTGKWLPHCWDRDFLSSIKSLTNNLATPTVSQGKMTERTTDANGQKKYSDLGDSMIVLNFISYPDTQQTKSKIWQVNHSVESLSNNWTTLTNNFESYSYVKPLIGTGFKPHLALMPAVTGRVEWLHNRRIFEADRGEAPPEIASSIFLFAKKNFNNPESAYPFFGYVDNERKILITPPWFTDENDLDFAPRLYTHIRNDVWSHPLDTIYTDWFSLIKIKNLNFLSHGTNNNDIDIKIERKGDKRKIQLNYDKKISSVISNHKFKLINGLNDEYRILFIKKNPNARYTEELIIGELPNLSELVSNDTSSLFQKGIVSNLEQVIDLGNETNQIETEGISLFIYPNPVDDNFYLTAFKQLNAEPDIKESNLLIKIYSNLGILLYTDEVKSGQTISIPTNEYPPGAYFIRAEEKIDSFDKLPAVIENFIIQR